jgi:hypothetical protein
VTDDDRYTRITLRIPKDLHALLQESADASSKSINAEIIERVRQSFGGAPQGGIEDILRTILGRLDALDAVPARKRGK